MAERSSNKPDFSTHPLVKKLGGDSDNPPSLVALTGYFGPSKKADTVLLYQSLDFGSYVELPKAAIVATVPTDTENEDSPTVVYVKAGTPVNSTQTSTQPVESYVQGPIAGGLQAQIDGTQSIPRTIHPTTTVLFTHQVFCPHPNSIYQCPGGTPGGGGVPYAHAAQPAVAAQVAFSVPNPLCYVSIRPSCRTDIVCTHFICGLSFFPPGNPC